MSKLGSIFVFLSLLLIGYATSLAQLKPKYGISTSDMTEKGKIGIEDALYTAPIPRPTATSTATATATSTATATATSTATATATSTATATATATVSGPTLVQQKTGSITEKTFTFDFDSAITPGNAVIIRISYLNTQSVASIDVNAEALTQEVISNGTGVATEIWARANIFGSGVSVNFNFTDTTDVVVNMSEWSGLNNAGAENTNSGVAVLSSTVSTGSVTPLSTNNLVIAAGAWTADDYSSGPTNSFTRMTQVGFGTTFQESAYRIQTTATARSTGWGLSAGINWSACIAVFGAPP